IRCPALMAMPFAQAGKTRGPRRVIGHRLLIADRQRPSPTNLGFTRDWITKVRKSTLVDLQWLGAFAPGTSGGRIGGIANSLAQTDTPSAPLPKFVIHGGTL